MSYDTMLANAVNECESLRAVVDAAIVYCHKLKDGYHGRSDSTYIISKSLKNLHEEVAAFEEREKNL